MCCQVPVKEQIFAKVEETEELETLPYEPRAPEGVGPDWERQEMAHPQGTP